MANKKTEQPRLTYFVNFTHCGKPVTKYANDIPALIKLLETIDKNPHCQLNSVDAI